MNNDKKVIKGIHIIEKHVPKDKDFSFDAEHDKIYFGDYDWVKGKDRAKLKRLGWYEDEDGWAHYV